MGKFLTKVKDSFFIKKEDRPCWFVDAKWIFALAFILLFSVSLTSFNIMQLTNRERAVEALTGMIDKTLTSAEGDILQRIDEYKQSLDEKKTSGESEESKIGKALSYFFPEQEIIDKPASELKEGFLQKLAVPVYEEGTSVVFTLLRGIDYASPIENALQRIPIYSDETHDTLMNWFVTTFVISMILLVGVIYFSWGWGKVFNPGLIFVIAASPGFFGYGYAHKFIKGILPDVAAEGGNFFVNTFLVGIVETLEKNIKDASAFQSTWFWIGVVLIAVAIAGKIFMAYWKKGKKSMKSGKGKK